MAKLIPNEFQEYEFENEAEEKSAYIFNEGNIYFIRNLLAMEAKRKLNITYDLSNPTSHVQEEAEVQGAMRAYRTILATHENTISQLNSGR